MRCDKLDAVEEGGGAPSVEFPHGKRVDDGREGDLDGVTILKGIEVYGSARGSVGRGAGATDAGVAAVMALVEEAKVLAIESWGLALRAVGLNVAAETALHWRSFFHGLGGTPGVDTDPKRLDYRHLGSNEKPKIFLTNDLWLNYGK
jgi:hypothetical protein